MRIISENEVDILLNENGQPVPDGNGDLTLVSGDECWLQDIKNEALTQEGELFYEDEDGNDSYGWGFLDFLQAEGDEFLLQEIKQRIRAKMAKRDYIDAASIHTEISFDGRLCHIDISFKRVDNDQEYNIGIETDGVEVIVE